jgi:oligopeptide transport system substrate-binding protein
LGVDVQLTNQDYKVYLDTMNALDYDLARSIWIGDVIDPVNFLECFLTDGGNNRTGWSLPAFDQQLAAAYAEPDAAKRLAFLQQAETILLDEAPLTPLFFMTQKYLQSPRVKNVQPNVLGMLGWRDIALGAP